MKRVIAFLLACVICLAALSGCGASNITTITETTVATETVPVVREAVNTYPAADGFSGGDGTEENPYQISTAAELAFLSESCSGSNPDYDLKNSCYILTQDIYLNETDGWESWGTDAPEYAWVPIRAFDGTFDGQGHTIYGMYINDASVQAAYTDSELAASSTTFYVGLFSSIGSNGSNEGIKNVEIAASYLNIHLDAHIGSIAAQSSAPITNCSSDAVIELHGDGYEIGGIVGTAYSGLENCVFQGSIIGKGSVFKAGGIAAVSSGAVANCVNEGTITAEASAESAEIGGIVCHVFNGVISDCVNRAALSADGTNASVGGVFNTVFVDRESDLISLGEGWVYSNGSIAIQDCANEGDIAVNGDSNEPVGGVIAHVFNSDSEVDFLSIENCSNTGSVTGGECVGGIVGDMSGYYVPINLNNCTNEGDISASIYVGGIVAKVSSPSGTATIQGCTNSGNVFAEEAYVGGIVGTADSINLETSDREMALTVEDCINSGTVSSTQGIGGTAGILGSVQSVSDEMVVQIVHCFNDGSVRCETTGRAGGIFGAMSVSYAIPVEIEGCGNTGDILFGEGKSLYDAGAGDSLSDYSADDKAYLVLGGNCAGGIAGMMQNFYIADCVSCGEICWDNYDTPAFVGGILGQYRYLDENDYMEGLGIRDCVYSTASEGLPGYILCFESDESLATISNVQQVSAADALAKLEAMKQTA